jgi:hypothetical protein
MTNALQIQGMKLATMTDNGCARPARPSNLKANMPTDHDDGDTQNMNGLDGGYEPPQILKSLAYRRCRQPVTKLVDHSRLLCRFAAHLVRQSLWKATVRRNR